MTVLLIIWLSMELLQQDTFGLNTMETVTKYTIYNTPHTWNEARAICNSLGARLLTINNATEWTLWQYLVGPSETTNLYWTGIHAPNPADQDAFYWDTCDDVEFRLPLVNDIVPGYLQCVYVWFHREIFNTQFLSMWIKGKPCNDSLPFICEDSKSNASCFPACDEVLYAVTERTCINTCKGNQSCTSNFNQMLNICHLELGQDSRGEYLTICRLPYLEPGYTTCKNNTDQSVDTTVTDQNINVTDKLCLEQNTESYESTTFYEETSTALTETTRSITNTNGIEITDSTESVCMCSCNALHTFLAEPLPGKANLTIEEKIDIIVKELIIDKKNTTSSQRKHISVMDYRPSSVGLGSVSVGIIVAIVGVIVIIDLSRFWHGAVKLLGKIGRDAKSNKVNVIMSGKSDENH